MSSEIAKAEPSAITVPDKPLLYNGEPVITLTMMDQLHQRPQGTAGRNFRRHRGQLREGPDYIQVADGDFPTNFVDNATGRPSSILLTESGYLLLVKSFRDPLAWDVQRALVNGYFRSNALQTESQLVSHAAAARLISDGISRALAPIIQPLVDGQLSIRGEVKDLRNDFNEFKNDVRTQLSQIGPKRLHLTKDTKRKHLDALMNQGGFCPCGCGKIIVDEYGNALPELEWEHRRGRGQNAVQHTWAVCKSANLRLRDDANFARGDGELLFNAYQAKREEYERRLRPMLPWGSA